MIRIRPGWNSGYVISKIKLAFSAILPSELQLVFEKLNQLSFIHSYWAVVEFTNPSLQVSVTVDAFKTTSLPYPLYVETVPQSKIKQFVLVNFCCYLFSV